MRPYICLPNINTRVDTRVYTHACTRVSALFFIHMSMHMPMHISIHMSNTSPASFTFDSQFCTVSRSACECACVHALDASLPDVTRSDHAALMPRHMSAHMPIHIPTHAPMHVHALCWARSCPCLSILYHLCTSPRHADTRARTALTIIDPLKLCAERFGIAR